MAAFVMSALFPRTQAASISTDVPMPAFLCWADAFVHRQCCDTEAYGPNGLELCFTQSGRSFARCCSPFANRSAAAGQQVQLLASWWDASHEGCRSSFFWLPHVVATMISSGPSYNPRTGAILDSRQPSLRERVHDIQQHLTASKKLTFEAFFKGAALYYQTHRTSLELLVMVNEAVATFGDCLAECAPVALVASMLKAEMVFHRDRAVFKQLTVALGTLSERALQAGRVPQPFIGALHTASSRVAALAARRHQEKAATVDVVVPLCSEAELVSLSEGLRSTFAQLQDLAEAPPPSAGGHPGWGGAQFKLILYDVCGAGAFGEVQVRAQPTTSEVIAARVFADFPEAALRVFCAEGRRMPLVYLASLSEEVPTGDVAAYLHHLAEGASAGSLADVTLFLHADFLEHVRPAMIDHVFGALINGAWPHDAVDFLYLGWRHEGPVQQEGERVASHIRYHCNMQLATGRLGQCNGRPLQPLARDAHFGIYNPVLLENLWRLAFGRAFTAPIDDFGGFDFAQLLVSRRAALRRAASYWRDLSQAISARASYQLLPGTTFISRRVDLTASESFNKGVGIWFENIWHLLFDPRFFPDAVIAPAVENSTQVSSFPRLGAQDLRAFTRVGDRLLPLGLRMLPDSTMMRHYWLSAEEQCNVLKDSKGCHLAKLQHAWQPAP